LERERRFEAIALARPGELASLADTVLSGVTLEILRGPQVGMLMLRALDSVDGIRFNVGEVLVTEALVAIGPHKGYAMIQGTDREHALAGAILDAAVESDHPQTARILTMLHMLEDRSRDERKAAWTRVAPTRVVFDEM
jgi:alpha-D-ribose 1-methylphosphonate 5-triphosphate synthase subunit PhnG